MGAHRGVAPESKNETWTTCTRSSKTPEWNCVGAADWRTLARHAGTVWEVDDDLQPVLTVAQIRSGTGCWPSCSTALDVESNVDWEIHFIVSTTVRAHQHAVGAKKAARNEKL